MSIRLKSIKMVTRLEGLSIWWENGGKEVFMKNGEDWKKEKPNQNPIWRVMIEDSRSKKI